MKEDKAGFESENIKLELTNNCAVIRFIRPEIKNPLSIAALETLKEIFISIQSNSKIETIIFTGSGDTFASGANLNEIAKIDGTTAREFALRGQNLMQAIYHSGKLTVAAIDGFCMGGALDLAVSCKTRIASPRSIFAHPGANLGIITGWSGTQILPRLIGEARALEMFLTAKRVDANEALRIGLIDEITENPLEFSLANFRSNLTS
ncbi:MAG: enoyl-CoA hydratase/isomerase family protein [Pyrinomonadaceae bacterium]